MVNAYQGILPTYLYAFQFPVSTVDRNKAIPILTPTLLVLTIVLTVACLVVAYSAWVWRLARPSRREPQGPAPATIDGLARSGGRLRDRRPEIGRQRAARGQPADDEPVVVLDLGRHPRPAERLGSLAPGRAHLGAQAAGRRAAAPIATARSRGSCGGTSRPSRSRRTTPL